MAKRFINIDIFSTEAFRNLNSSLKSLYWYVWGKADHCGVYKIDKDYLSADNKGVRYSEQDFEKLRPLGVIKISAGKFLIKDFIEVNYGQLKENYNPHKPAFRDLLKNKLKLAPSLNQASLKLVEEDEDKEEDEEEDKGIVKGVKNPEAITPELWPTFEDFWNAYDKKNDRVNTERIWKKLKQPEKEAIMRHVPEYVKSTPDKKYRKNPDTYLNQKAWNDEIITSKTATIQQGFNTNEAAGNDRAREAMAESLAKRMGTGTGNG